MRSLRRIRIRLTVLATAACLTGPVGCQTWTSGMTLPSGYYLRHTPQYFPQDPSFPLPRELASMEDPAGAQARAGAAGFGAGPAPVAPATPVPMATGGMAGIAP